MRKLRVLAGCECSGRVRDAFAARGFEAWSADILPSETPVNWEACGKDWSGTGSPLGTQAFGMHYQGDVRDLFSWDHPVNTEREREAEADPNGIPLWDLCIMFPECTDLSYAGARWFAQKRADGRQQAAADFFMDMINAPAPFTVVENPRGVMFSRYRRPDQEIHPWMFGDPFRKTTCLWLKNLPLLVPEYSEPGVLATVTSGDSAGYRLHQTVTSGSTVASDPRHDFNGRMHYEDSEGRKNRAKVRSRTFPGLARAFAEQFGSYVEGFYSGNCLDMRTVKDGSGNFLLRKDEARDGDG